MSCLIGSSSVLCAGGRGIEQLWATARAGISCIKNSHFADRKGRPIQAAFVPDDALATLPESIESSGLPSIARRMLRIAAPALKAIAAPEVPSRVYLAVAEPAGSDAPWLRTLLSQLSIAAEVPVDLDSSRLFPGGRAAAFTALEAASAAIAQQPTASILVGGVDSYLDLRLLDRYDREGRILTEDRMDGFLPGEGAAFLDLHGPGAGRTRAAVRLVAASGVMDAGHRYGTEPARGEGLASALDRLRESADAWPGMIQSTFAGFNGEAFDAKLWGVARLRHRDIFAGDASMLHPADCYGDAGAATGALLTALAAFALASGGREGPALAWAASDQGLRGCSLMSVH